MSVSNIISISLFVIVNKLIKEIFETKTVKDQNDVSYPLHSHIGYEDGLFLQQLIEKYDICNALEVGCAYGISTLFICEALAKKKGKVSHTAIDVSQSSFWKNIGIANVKRAGFDFFQLDERISEFALPGHLIDRKSYDFIFIDGWHTFDHVILDFFYCYRLLNLNGIIVIDDAQLPSIQKFIGYISQYPSVKFVDRYISNAEDKIIIAYQKISKDQRDWDWFCDF